MMRSLYSGISGLKNHQTRMDIIGNNIANVNTIGYKTSRTVFQDIYSQTLRAGSAATADKGGTNPVQIGLGVKLSAIDIIHTSAPTQRSDNPLDIALDGDGFFIVQNPQTGINYYTRAGNLGLDDSGNLVTTDGYFVQGYKMVPGMKSVYNGIEALDFTQTPAVATGNFISVPPIDAEILDLLSFNFEDPTAAGTFDNYPDAVSKLVTALSAAVAAGVVMPVPNPNDPNNPPGMISPTTPGETETNVMDQLSTLIASDYGLTTTSNDNDQIMNALAMEIRGKINALFNDPTVVTIQGLQDAAQDILDQFEADAQTQFDTAKSAFGAALTEAMPTITSTQIDAYVTALSDNTAPLNKNAAAIPDGTFSADIAAGLGKINLADYVGISVDYDGTVYGIKNDIREPISMLGVAMFANTSGLEKIGNSLYGESGASGPAYETTALNDGAGKMNGGGLEMSNVDLSTEFTDMIITQRGYQANSRIITVSDTMLEELVNLKR